jgi:hypothetical protein
MTIAGTGGTFDSTGGGKWARVVESVVKARQIAFPGAFFEDHCQECDIVFDFLWPQGLC